MCTSIELATAPLRLTAAQYRAMMGVPAAETAPARMSAADYVALITRSGKNPARTLAAFLRQKDETAPTLAKPGRKGRISQDQVRAIIADDTAQSEPFCFVIDAHPTPKERARHGRHGGYTPKQTRKFEARVKKIARLAMAQAGRRPFRIPIWVSLVHVFEGREDEYPVGVHDGDLSNITKACEDAMNGVVYTDDRLIVDNPKHGKICGPRSEIRVEVRPAL